MTDLPAGYRWAREDELDRPDAIAVPRTTDHTGNPYTGNEADIAVPMGCRTTQVYRPHYGWVDRPRCPNVKPDDIVPHVAPRQCELVHGHRGPCDYRGIPFRGGE